MIRNALMATLLVTPPFSGPLAPILSVVALAAPTAILSLDHALPAGACCTTYFPFVLLSAVLLGPIYASAVAIGSAGLADALFMGPRYQILESPMDSFGDIASLVSSALIIGLVYLFRRLLAHHASRQASVHSSTGIIFSLEQGVAWASWTGVNTPVRLGPHEEVAEMMQDFLAQIDLGKRLTQSPR
jgi:hypothetical protein